MRVEATITCVIIGEFCKGSVKGRGKLPDGKGGCRQAARSRPAHWGERLLYATPSTLKLPASPLLKLYS